jgi:AraC family transcriptional regulator
MSKALRIFQGKFGRVALLDMDAVLINHAHPHCHVLIKSSGADTFFAVRDQLCPLRDDTAVLINAWEPHSYAHQPGAPPSIILALYIEPRWLADMQKEFTASARPGFFPHSCGELSPRIRRLADRMTDELLFNEDAGPAHEELLFDLMIAVIERFSEWRSLIATRRTARLPASDYRIRKAVAHMRESLGSESLDPEGSSREFNIEEVARSAGLSRAHLFRLFQSTLGITPALYFNVLRMEAAFDDLADAEHSITDISGRLGFAAPSHFTRFFRHNQGVTPTEYRRVVNLIAEPGSAPGAGPSAGPIRVTPWKTGSSDPE